VRCQSPLVVCLRAFALLSATGGCGDQAFVVFVGTLSEAEPGGASRVSFEEEPSEDARPIEGALVSLCEEQRCNATTNEEGFWGPIWHAFPLFSKRTIHLTVRADGYETITFETRYPPKDTPVGGEALLHVRLRPLADAPPAAAPLTREHGSGT